MSQRSMVEVLFAGAAGGAVGIEDKSERIWTLRFDLKRSFRANMHWQSQSGAEKLSAIRKDPYAAYDHDLRSSSS